MKKASRVIPGTLSFARQGEIGRPADTLSGTNYLTPLEQTRLKTDLESKVITIFRLQKCARPTCDAMVPKDTHKLFCSQACAEEAEKARMEEIKARVQKLTKRE